VPGRNGAIEPERTFTIGDVDALTDRSKFERGPGLRQEPELLPYSRDWTAVLWDNMQEEDAQGRSGAISRRSATRESINSTSSTNSHEQRWFAHVQGQNYGPYTDLDIKQMAENNQIVATDFLWPEGGSAWTEAKDEPLLGVLFQSDAQGTAQPAASSAHAGTGVRADDYRALFRRAHQDQIQQDLGAFFGPRAEKYLAVYEKMRSRNMTYAPFTANWTVFFTSFPWFFYRRMYLAGSLIIFLPLLAAYLFGSAGNIGIGVVLAVLANSQYVLSGMRRMLKADALGLAGEERQEYLRRAGGVSVVAGVLASILFVTMVAVAILGLYLKDH
jgi:hypothetical protein